VIPDVGPEELAVRLAGEAPPLVLDVRTGLEFRMSRIEGAQRLSLLTFSTEFRRLEVPADRAIVAVCLSAHRSVPIVARLIREGYPAAQLRGGMIAWWKAGLPTVRG
jgi:rhodanese-related sulfurtransferase